MQIGQICNPVVVVARKEMSVADAARLMCEENVGSLVVVEDGVEGRKVTGILTDRDIVLSVVARDLDARTVKVSEVMEANPVSVTTTHSVADALHRMRQHGVRRIPVLSPNGVLEGIVTVDDVLAIIAEELNDLVSTINRQQEREGAARK